VNGLNHWKIGARLGAGFGLVLTLLLAMVVAASVYLGLIGDASRQLSSTDMVKAEAAETVDIYTRANARRTMEMFFVTDEPERQRIQGFMDGNKQKITDALAVLDRLVVLDEGRAILARIKPLRADYVASFTQTLGLLQAGDRSGAEAHLRSATLPALDRLQAEVSHMGHFQAELATTRSRQISQDAGTARTTLWIVGALALLSGTLAAWWLTRSITTPIEQAVQIARTVAQGDLTASVPVGTRSAGDETGQLLQALHEMTGNLVQIVGQVRQSSESIATGSSQIAMGNADLSQRTESQASSLEETAASMEQLTHTVRSNTETAQEASRLALSASDSVAEGSQAVDSAVQTMDAIADASRRIAEITGVIDGIAFQTNILALNAAVEAARAGEQGRGFAVVATEVRTLAQRSADAAREIKSLIATSTQRVETGSRQVQDAGRTMGQIVTQVKKVASLVADISQASTQQSAGIGQVGEAVSLLDQVTQQNAALVEEGAAAAESLKNQAENLASVVRAFRLA
jgi:methyl-accepting chemotaxis protein